MHKGRNRKRFQRFLVNVLLFPARLPVLRIGTVDIIKRICESSGVLLILSLMVGMAGDSRPAVIISIIAGTIFFVTFFLIRLRIYQGRLARDGYI